MILFLLFWVSFSQEIPLSTIDTSTLQSPFFIVTNETEKVKYELKACNTYKKTWSITNWTPSDLVYSIITKSYMVYIEDNMLNSSTEYYDYKCSYDTFFIEKVPVYKEIRIDEFIVLSPTTVVFNSSSSEDKTIVVFSNTCIQETPWSKVYQFNVSLEDWRIKEDSVIFISYTQNRKTNCVVSSVSDYIEPVQETVDEQTMTWTNEEVAEEIVDPRIVLFNSVWDKYIKENWTKKAMEIAKEFIPMYVKKQGKLWSNEEVGKEIYIIFSEFLVGK